MLHRYRPASKGRFSGDVSAWRSRRQNATREDWQDCRCSRNIAGRFYGDPAKALVMTHIGQFVRDGYAEWTMLDNGDVELRFFSGEVFLLADATMTRVA